jgi:hypothetical protein
MENIVRKLSQESKKPESVIRELMGSISFILLKEGCEKTDPRFLRYLIRRTRKRLKIQESQTFKTFKEFFKEK